ncbi:hypothetical protein LIER_37397 [Lithospermum erythrorhizon]|uniref:Uncharacterized protein n=1 Tax=Lithospermum erythrorhizon TaxID=34254 RepID=A0AAV3PM36_LITER
MQLLTPDQGRNIPSTHHMTWHNSNRAEAGFMTHPSHSGTWHHFNDLYPDFASQSRNVRIGLYTDGFNPFGQFGRNYSCWPVIVCVYNLSPGLCMKYPYIFLSPIVPGPKSPERDLDVFLRPLIDELTLLWNDGIVTYDVARKENFTMRVTLMWTISDFPTYGMLSGLMANWQMNYIY